MKTVLNKRARRHRWGRARRPVSESLARSRALFLVLQGMALLVILSGLILITVGMMASVGAFVTDLSARAEARRAAEADIPIPLTSSGNAAGRAAWTGPGDPPGAQPAAAERTPAAASSGFLPYQVPVDQLDEQAPELPSSAEAAPDPDRVTRYFPIISVPGPTPEPIYVTATPVPSPTPVPPGPPERIVIPIIALDAPVSPAYTQLVQLHGEIFEQWTAPDWYAAGWQQGSAQVGEAGNTVLNGHHNIHGSVFALLKELIQGDEIIVYSGEREYRYIVSQVMNVQERGVPLAQRQENARWVLPSTDERLTLVTCWPPESNTHRIIVVAVPVP